MLNATVVAFISVLRSAIKVQQQDRKARRPADLVHVSRAAGRAPGWPATYTRACGQPGDSDLLACPARLATPTDSWHQPLAMESRASNLFAHLYWVVEGIRSPIMSKLDALRGIEKFSNCFNLLASVFKYIVIQNDTGSDITVFVTATGNHRVLVESSVEASVDIGLNGVALGGGKRIVQDRACTEPPQIIHISYKRGEQQRISLIESKSYITVIAPLRNGRGFFILANNILVKTGRIYCISTSDYNTGLANYHAQQNAANDS